METGVTLFLEEKFQRGLQSYTTPQWLILPETPHGHRYHRAERQCLRAERR